MASHVSLTCEGHVDPEDVAEALAELRCGPVSFTATRIERPRVDEPLHGTFVLRDPSNRRKSRELTMMQGATYRDEEEHAHIVGNAYTRFYMGSHGGGAIVMGELARRYGGRYADDSRPETDRLVEAGAPPAPLP